MATALQRPCGALLVLQVPPPSPEMAMPPGLAAAAIRLPLAEDAKANQGCAVGLGSRGVHTVPGATLPGSPTVTMYWAAFCASCQRPLPCPMTLTWSPPFR